MKSPAPANLLSRPEAGLAVIRLALKLLLQVVILVFALEVILDFALWRLNLLSSTPARLFADALVPLILLPVMYTRILKPVTELTRQQAEQAAETRFQTIAHSLQEAIIICDLELNVRFANAAAERQFGFFPGEWKGMDGHSLLPPGTRKYLDTQLQQLREAGDAPFLHAGPVELEVARKDGATFVAEASFGILHGDHGTELVVIARDISQRKMLEDLLRRSEAHFRMVADEVPVILWLTDSTGRCNYANRPWLKICGEEFFEDLDTGWKRCIHPEDLESTVRTYEGHLARREAYSIEYRVRFPDGSYHWMEDRGNPRFLADGSYAGHIGLCYDITERKAAEQALRESEAKFRALTETVTSGIFISRDDRLLYANRQTEALLGYSRRELLHMSFWDLIHPDFRALVRERREERLAGKEVPARYEFKIVTRSGEERWIDFTASVIEYAGEPAVLGTAFDITERKAAEQKLAEQAALLDALVQTSPLAKIAVDSEGRVKFCNPAFEKLFQYRASDFEGKNVDELLTLPEHREEAQELTATNVTGQYKKVTSKRRRKDGTLVEVEIHAVPLVVHGKTIGSYGVYVDLTDRVKLQMYEKLLPVCCVCGKIRDDSAAEKGQGTWDRLDRYVMKHSDARISHTFCPPCLEEYKRREGLT